MNSSIILAPGRSISCSSYAVPLGVVACGSAAFLAVWGGQRKSATAFRRFRFAGRELFYELFTKSLLLEMPQENLIRRLQGFVILPVSGANPLHCGNEYIVIAALTLELL